MLRTPGKEAFGQEALGGCLPVFLVVGILFVYAGLKAERQKRELEKLAGYLKAYRRIKIPTLASKLHLSEYETERRIIRCVRLGMLTGYMDRASDDFFNPRGMEGNVLINCPNCGGSVEQMVIEGETGKCPYCGSLILQAK
jgi:DNA-directed RNA polymerase subunit RPC12/RpoP